MTKTLRRETPRPQLLHILIADCDNCRGLCCVGLYFSAADGFPADKEAGVKCTHLQSDCRCDIHSELAARGMKGCMAFDCLGAGQRTAAGGGTAAEQAERFPAMWRFHRTLWNLHEALCLLPAEPIWSKLESLLDETGCEIFPSSRPCDLDGYEARASVLLHRAWSLTREAVGRAAPAGDRGDFLGKDFKKADLSGADFAMALLIAANLSGCKLYGANLLGADLRDADLRGADLSESLFLTQAQVNSAKGDKETRLPAALRRPESWK